MDDDYIKAAEAISKTMAEALQRAALDTEVQKLKSENERLSLEAKGSYVVNGHLLKDLDALRALAAWHEKRAQFVTETLEAVGTAYLAFALLTRWDKENPKP